MQLTTEQRLKKAHVAMMKHPETALYSGVFMLGTSAVSDEPITAYTDGVNKKYGRAFVEAMCPTDAELNALVLHENLHIVFRHIIHNRDLFERNRSLANMAADYVVNDVIMNLKDKSLAKLPEGGLYDSKYHNMSMREVFFALEKEQKECKKPKEPGDGNKRRPNGQGEGQQGQQGQAPQPDDDDDDDDGGNQTAQGNDPGRAGTQNKGGYKFDDHDIDGQHGQGGKAMSKEELAKIDRDIDRAIREGALLAGRLGVKAPRSIEELLDPVVDWKQELAEFVSSTTKGKDEYTWRKFNRRLVANDVYMPTVENETIGEVIVAIDTSGSIGQAQINEFASELASICEAVSPDAVRVLWWDTMVHGEQKFTDNYDRIGSMLKPLGGGGTRVGCVSEYINKHKVKADCVLVFTDGYVEGAPQWLIDSPTLWLVTENKSWTPPAGRMVPFTR